MRASRFHPNTTWLLLLAACAKTPASEAAGTAQLTTVPGCGAALEVPAVFQQVKLPTGKLERLRLTDPDGETISVSCLPKAQKVPLTLQAHSEWLVGEIVKSQPSVRRGATGAQQVDGHLALTQELYLGIAGVRSVWLFTERASSFYWLSYTAPGPVWEKSDKLRAQLLQSFRVTDAAADRGPTRWWHPELKDDPRKLADARAAFHTKVRKGRPARGFDGAPAPNPPAGTFERVSVAGPVGRLSAYITPDPKDAKKHPAVVWAHGGFGGIDSWFWDAAPRSNDQSARAFRNAGIVLAAGSWRAENDNPGDYELYYGEVDDFLAVRDHVAKLPYVDPERIYLAGHSSGGTLVLLAAEKSDGFRAAFSLGGSPVFLDAKSYDRYGGVPFDPTDADETRLRSSAFFYRSIRRPTFYFEGSGSASPGSAQWMADQAAKTGAMFWAFVAMQADHFSLVAPLTELIAQKILADSGPTTNITFNQAEIDALRVER